MKCNIIILSLLLLVACHKQEDNNEFIQTCVDRLPVWSPDGKDIAFYRNPTDAVIAKGFQEPSVITGYAPYEINDNDDTLAGIRILNLETMEIDFLVAGSAPDWSPDGKEIVYNPSASVGIRTIDLQTNQTKEITNFNGQRPKWSPDGYKIVCEVNTIDVSGIYFVDTMGNVRQVFAWAVEPNWHPDGERLIFLGQFEGKYGICIGDTVGNIVRLVCEGPIGQVYPEFSPDGSKIVYCLIGDKSIHAIDTLGNNDVILSEGYDPSWSPDGQKIVFAAMDTIENKISYSLWTMNADGSNKMQITYPDN